MFTSYMPDMRETLTLHNSPKPLGGHVLSTLIWHDARHRKEDAMQSNMLQTEFSPIETPVWQLSLFMPI